MKTHRVVSCALALASLFAVSLNAFASPAAHASPPAAIVSTDTALQAMPPREEAAEDRAEISLRIRRENADHRYALALKRCGVQQSPPQGECATSARSAHQKEMEEAQAAYETSHERALLLGKAPQ